MSIITKAAGLAILVFALVVPAAAAGADPYSSPDTPSNGGIDNPSTGGVGSGGAEETPRGEGAGVLPNEAEKPAAETTPSGGGTDVLPSSATRSAAAAETAPSGALPFTGGDIVGITVIGAGALGLGTILVRRSRKAGLQAA